MAKYVIDETTLQNLANAIRGITGESASYTPEEMVEKIKNLEVGGKPKTISFILDGVTYTAEEGMTWGEWVVSDYNPTKPDGCDGDTGRVIDTFVIKHGYCQKMTMCSCEELTYAYIAPVKSVIKADVKLKIFTLDDGEWGTPCCFEVGMTWAEYAASEYNPIVFCAHGHDDIEEYKLFVIGDEGVYMGTCPVCEGEGALMLDGAYVRPDDEVIADAYYGWSNPDEDNPDEDNPDEGDDGLIEFSIGSFDGGADTFHAYEGMTWEEFADSEDNLAPCDGCGDELPAITISDGHVYCNCVVHDAAGERFCSDCYGGVGQRLYYIDDDGSEIYVQATDDIVETEYYCHELLDSDDEGDSTTITFYITDGDEDVKCTAEAGMTWGEWIESGMAPGEFRWEYDMLWYGSWNDDNGITLDDEIIAGESYYFTPN